MCKKAVGINPLLLVYVHDHIKTKEMCGWAVEDDPNTLEFVPDWFVKREWVYMWHDDYYDDGHWHDDWNDKFSQ